jgi:stearoyl-CoA desaturase (delta-9 desaturase)
MSNKWWEVDIGWAYIRILAMCRLAKVKRLAPRRIRGIGKHLVDRDTALAVVSHRFLVLKRYGQMVIRPALREAKRNTDRMGRRLIRRARRLMTREGIPVDQRAAQTIDLALLQDETLATIYRFKQQLKEVWAGSSKDGSGRVERLRTWCTASEQSGIQVLEEFAVYLRGYQLEKL